MGKERTLMNLKIRGKKKAAHWEENFKKKGLVPGVGEGGLLQKGAIC